MLDGYLARIGLTHRPDSSPEGLAELQRAHRMAIGFENFDVMLGRAIRLDLASVWAKLGARRGGYCFEHNALFGAMVEHLGLPNRPLLARVWLGLGGPDSPDAALAPPLVHTLRLVRIGDETWLADAGFGGSYVPPLPLVDGARAETPDGARHRLVRREAAGDGSPPDGLGDWLIERIGPATATDGRTVTSDAWAPQYSFALTAVAPLDLELGNWWASTRPETRFTQACRASIVLPDGFASLNGTRLSRHVGGTGEVIDLTNAEDWRAALADLFQVELSRDEVARLDLF
ncbi:arylamine N-acetyltransferase [Novosphingobium sp.]|uniref:arylamine N-acetyltransferase family protein n=1 Tax=Novosphingobium sp. TaxID=1874826 RepID=UPI002623C862|nr:arylamine N-acetyltransferase [Novosphingobium sp.]